MASGRDLVDLLMHHIGGPYGYGSKWALSNPNPSGPVDCSGFVAWGCYQIGRPLSGGSGQQYAKCAQAGTLIPIKQAIATPGALLFHGPHGEYHIACSRGDGMTVEARGAAYGVGCWSAYNRPWDVAALVPGVSYANTAPPTVPAPAPAVPPPTSPPVAITWNGVPAMKQTLPVPIDTNGNGQAPTNIPADQLDAMTPWAEGQYKNFDASPLNVNGKVEIQVTGHTPSAAPPAAPWWAYVTVVWSD